MAIQRVMRKVFGLYPGEGRTTWHFARLTMTWTFGALMADTLSISSFLQKVGAQYLPLNYLCISIGMMLTSSMLISLLRYFSTGELYRYILLASTVFYSCVVAALFFPLPTVFWTCLQICTPLFVVTTNATFWSFLDHYHDLQEAKRIYGIYNSCYFLGLMLAGTVINRFIDMVGIQFLYGLAVVSLFLASLQVKKIIATHPAIEDDLLDEAIVGKKRKISSLIHEFLKSPFTLLLVSISLIIQLLITCTEFSYMTILDRVFHAELLSNENVIAGFLGKIKAFIALGNILSSMFIYRRCIRHFGIQNMMLLPPLVFVTIYTQWLFFDGLWLAVVGVIAIEGILYSIEDSNFNLLTNVASAKLKGILRLINDSFFEPMGMLISSLCLFILTPYVHFFGWTLALIFLMGVLIVKRYYSKALGDNIQQNAIRFSRKLGDWLFSSSKKEQKEIAQDLQRFLTEGDEKTKLLIAKYILESEEKEFLKLLLNQAENFSPQGKLAFLKMIDPSIFSREKEVIDLFQSWLKKEKPSALLRWVRFYLIKKGAITIANATQVVSALSNDKIFRTLHLLKEEESFEAFERAFLYLNHNSLRIQQKSAEILASVATPDHLSYAPKLLSYLRASSDNQFRLYLLEAIGKIQDLDSMKTLILSSLFFRQNENRLIETVVFKMGSDAIALLQELVSDDKIHNHCRILAAKILGKISQETLQNLLNKILSNEISRAYFYYYYACTLQKKHPDLPLSLLIHSLLSSYRSAIDFLLHLLGASHSLEDPDLLVKILRSSNAKSHADAIEILEKTCKKKLFHQLLPLIDDIPTEAKLDAYFQVNGKKSILTLFEVLDQMEQSPLPFDRTIGSYMKAKLNNHPTSTEAEPLKLKAEQYEAL